MIKAVLIQQDAIGEAKIHLLGFCAQDLHQVWPQLRPDLMLSSCREISPQVVQQLCHVAPLILVDSGPYAAHRMNSDLLKSL